MPRGACDATQHLGLTRRAFGNVNCDRSAPGAARLKPCVPARRDRRTQLFSLEMSVNRGGNREAYTCFDVVEVAQTKELLHRGMLLNSPQSRTQIEAGTTEEHCRSLRRQLEESWCA